MLPPLPTPLDPPCASIMHVIRPCCRRVCALSHVASVARLASFAGLRDSSGHRKSDASRACRLARGRTRSQRATLIKWIARVLLTTRKTRIQRSSRHPRTPRTPRRERPLRRPMVCRVGGFGSASGFLDIISQSSINRPSPLHLRQTHTASHTLVTAFIDLAHRHRRPRNAHSCIADFFQIKRSENVSAL